MADYRTHSNEDPQNLLNDQAALAAQVRKRQRATWLPLFTFALATFLAIPFLRMSHRTITNCATVNGGSVCHFYSAWGVWYWPAILVLSYIGISYFYIRRALALGLESRFRTFVWSGIIIAIAVTVLGYWAVHLPLGEVTILGGHFQERSLGWLHRMATPAFAIGLSLLFLAWIERNKALVYVDALFLAIILVPINFGWTMNSNPQWNFLPRLVIQGSFLLLAGALFAWIQKPWEGSAE